MAERRLQEFYKEISEDLSRCVNFWLKHSHDTEYGGFFDCLGPRGEVYDDTKHVWLQGRQVWAYARLYNEEEQYRRKDILETAEKAAAFLKTFAKHPKTWKCYLALTRDGRPIKMQRTIFSECFYAMAFSELAISTGNNEYREEALSMMDKIIYWVREDPTDLLFGYPSMAGEPEVNPLNVPMMLLCLVDQMETMDTELSERYAEIAEWSVNQIRAHIQRNGRVILENVDQEGRELPGSSGRMMVPGHSIEAGWFLLNYAIKNGRQELADTAIETFIIKPFEYGWDKKHGGLFYFLDVDELSPVQLEWNMKLWWTHNEAMIAFLMAYQQTGKLEILEKFEQVFDYVYAKHVDRKYGEWFGYLNRDGTVCMDFKGGPWKGCFHVPRALLMCKKMLEEITNKN